MVDSKENYKFDLGVEGLISSVNYSLSHKNKRNNQQLKNLWIATQILLVSILGNCREQY